jgi:hypothetical protein
MKHSLDILKLVSYRVKLQVLMAASMKMTAFWHIAIIALMMEAVRTSEMSVNFYETTRRNIPEGYRRLSNTTTKQAVAVHPWRGGRKGAERGGYEKNSSHSTRMRDLWSKGKIRLGGVCFFETRNPL